jgi:hypothetical protein
MPGNTVHFFSSRENGVNLSEAPTQWRYGKGNVFSPAANHPESKNASANVDAILSEYKVDNQHPGVILQSKYGKGISEVDDDFMQSTSHTLDSSGRIVIEGDGLFTLKTHIPLLNKSGDAHSVIFIADKAIGILVGSWRCLGKDIISLMLEKFAAHAISFDQITVHIGPGLGKLSFGIGQKQIEELEKVFGSTLNFAITKKINKKEEQKYYLDVHELMKQYAGIFGFHVDVSQSKDTFDKMAWKKVKGEAITSGNPLLPIEFYAKSSLFGARLYVRTDRLARRIVKVGQLALPEGMAQLADNVDYEDTKKAGEMKRYDETGRCLNGVMRR